MYSIGICKNTNIVLNSKNYVIEMKTISCHESETYNYVYEYTNKNI